MVIDQKNDTQEGLTRILQKHSKNSHYEVQGI